MSMRDALRMSEDEVARYLGNGHQARLATLNRDGSPHVVPVNYVVLDGNVAFWADADSQKVVNATRDPRVACVIDDGSEFTDYRGIQIQGRAQVSDDLEHSKRVGRAFLAKSPVPVPEEVEDQMLALAAERVVVEVVPDRVISWDHTKLSGVVPQEIGS